MGVAGLLSVLGIRAWDELAPLVMIVPILYMIAARLYRGHTQENPLVWVAHAATGVMIAAVLAAAMHLTPEHVVEPVTGSRSICCWRRSSPRRPCSTPWPPPSANKASTSTSARPWPAAPCGNCSQYWQVGAEYYTLIFALLGLGLLVCYRLAVLEWTGLAAAAFQCANALMSLSFVAAVLMTLEPAGRSRSEHRLVAGVSAAGPDGAESAGGVAGPQTRPAGDGTSSWQSPRPG